MFYCFFYPTSLGSRFKIQGWRHSDSRRFFGILNLESHPLGSKKFFGILNLESWILRPWIQEVFFGSWILNLESHPLWFKKFFGDLESWILNPMGSWILVPTPLDSRSFLWILNLKSGIPPPLIQEVLWGSWILNPGLEFKKFFWDLESWFLPPWIQEVFFGSWILNLESHPLWFKKFFGDLESWILALNSRSFFGILNLESWFLPPWIQEVFFGILNLESNPLCIQEVFFGSWILNPTPFDSRSFFWNLESWIQCTLGRVRWEQTCQKKMRCLITKKCPKF